MGIWQAYDYLLSDFKIKSYAHARSSERLLERLAPMPQVLLSSIQPNDQNIIIIRSLFSVQLWHGNFMQFTRVRRDLLRRPTFNKVTRLVALLARSTVCKESSATERSDVCGHPWCRCRLAVANASSDADRRSWQGDQCSPVDILLHVLVQRTHLRHWSTKESQRNRWSDRV